MCPWYYEFEDIFSIRANITPPFLSESGLPDRRHLQPISSFTTDSPLQEPPNTSLDDEEFDDEFLTPSNNSFRQKSYKGKGNKRPSPVDSDDDDDAESSKKSKSTLRKRSTKALGIAEALVKLGEMQAQKADKDREAADRRHAEEMRSRDQQHEERMLAMQIQLETLKKKRPDNDSNIF
jgi:hypothetical protein